MSEVLSMSEMTRDQQECVESIKFSSDHLLSVINGATCMMHGFDVGVQTCWTSPRLKATR